MSGHSKWATTHRQKEVADAKRGAIFTKIGNQIAIAARGGTNPDMNPALAMILEKAKSVNMPNANIERAIARVSDKASSAVEQVTYEAYGPGGIGIIIETATDNRNRTFPEVRTVLTKNGGWLADPGSVMFQFTRKGVIRINTTGEEALLAVLDAGASDAVEESNGLTVYTDAKALASVRQKIVDAGLKIEEAGLECVPNNLIKIDDPSVAEKVGNLLDAIDDLDDVTDIYSNEDI